MPFTWRWEKTTKPITESAGNHCNVGDVKLALDTMLEWMARLDARDEAARSELRSHNKATR